eukprot:Nk52_evm26s2011 gene=Nk52_evmTU26s2011
MVSGLMKDSGPGARERDSDLEDEEEGVGEIALEVLSGPGRATGGRAASNSDGLVFSNVGYAPLGGDEEDDGDTGGSGGGKAHGFRGNINDFDFDDEGEDDDDVTVYEADSFTSQTPEMEMEMVVYEGENDGEGPLAFISQSVPTLIIAGLGLVAAGLVLDKEWGVFDGESGGISEFYILVPPLLGLKGNLEMTLAARLSTAANLGVLDSPKERRKLIVASLALVQVQAIVVSLLASITAIILGAFKHGNLELNESIIIVCSSMFTTMICGFLLGSLMAAIIVYSRQFNINPDNIATPIAASLGDLVTLVVLVASSSAMFYGVSSTTQLWFLPALVFVMVISGFYFFSLARRHESVAPILKTGWSPIIIAMVISSVGGLLLEAQVDYFKALAALIPVINGVGGNVAGVYASRLTTEIHCEEYEKQGQKSIIALLLMILPPIQTLFLVIIDRLGDRHTSGTARFVCMYLLCAELQVILLFLIAKFLVNFFWKRGCDPDNYVLPYLTAFGDLIGTLLLVLGFNILWKLWGDGDADVGD